jgi:hypothetical protein
MTKTSKYHGVRYQSPEGVHDRWKARAERKPWRGYIYTSKGKAGDKCFATEREAAIYVDTINLQLRLGRPLNILKPKP